MLEGLLGQSHPKHDPNEDNLENPSESPGPNELTPYH